MCWIEDFNWQWCFSGVWRIFSLVLIVLVNPGWLRTDWKENLSSKNPSIISIWNMHRIGNGSKQKWSGKKPWWDKHEKTNSSPNKKKKNRKKKRLTYATMQVMVVGHVSATGTIYDRKHKNSLKTIHTYAESHGNIGNACVTGIDCDYVAVAACVDSQTHNWYNRDGHENETTTNYHMEEIIEKKTRVENVTQNV